jgi:hypothetical protein
MDDLDVAGLPASVLFGDAEAAARYEAEERAEQEREAEERAAAEREAAEAAEEQRRQDEAEAWRTAEPPSAEDLGIDVSGLPAHRARLCRYIAWREATRKRLADLERGRAAFLEQLGVPAQTEEKLKALIREDRSRLLQWMTGGAAADLKPKAREFERAELERRLAGDTHEAEVTRAAIAEADAEIERLGLQLGVLEKRHREFIEAALIGEAGTLGAEYGALVAQMNEVVTALFGLNAAIGMRAALRGEYASNSAAIELPRFNLPGVPGNRLGDTATPYAPTAPTLRVTEPDAENAAAPWRERMRLLSENPRAEIVFETKREHSA